MSIRKRLSQDESRTVALEAARALLIESGPQSVTLKAVAARINRTHANLLHHFGTALGLQKALARHLAATICATIAKAVVASRTASWMLLSGNEDALDPIVEAIHDMVDELHEFDAGTMREATLTLVLMALGDSLMGGPLSHSLNLPRTAMRGTALGMLIEAGNKAGLAKVPQEG
jgi:AcrR family transcriptional regulator